MTTTSADTLSQAHVAWAIRLQDSRAMLDEVLQGRHPTLHVLKQHADAVGAELIVVGGAAVIRHGYQRSTKDIDVLLARSHAVQLALRLDEDAAWERRETGEFAFFHVATATPVDFLVGGDLLNFGSPVLMPFPHEVERERPGIEDVPVIGLNDLVFLKIMAGCAKDEADIVELAKVNPGRIAPGRVTARMEADDPRRERLLELLDRARRELGTE